MSKKNIEFVSYNGAYPCLCMGELVVKIDGKTVTFGGYESNTKFEDGGKYPVFWFSRGKVTFSKDWSDFSVTKAPWGILCDNDEYPPEIVESFEELIELFNENVVQGCCGGCV